MTSLNRKKILVIKLRALGDTILTTAFLRELRRQAPDSEITVLVPKVWADAILHHPAIDSVWSFDTKASGLKYMAVWIATLQKIRAAQFDVCIGLHVGAKVERLCKYSGAEVRMAHSHDLVRPNRVSDFTIPNKGVVQPIWERDVDVLRALGMQVNSRPQTLLVVTHAENHWANEYLRSHHLKPPFLALGLGASRATKIWPMEYFADIACRWRQETQGSVLAFFNKSETTLYNRLVSEISTIKAANAVKNSLHPQTLTDEFSRILKPTWLVPVNRDSLREVMSLMANCDQFVGNDSGPKHMAAALNVPTLTVFGPEHPFEWHPYDTSIHKLLFVENLSCRTISIRGQPAWCGVSECKAEKHRCLRDSTPAQAWAALRPKFGWPHRVRDLIVEAPTPPSTLVFKGNNSVDAPPGALWALE